MNMDMLSRVFGILQRAGGMEQIRQLMVIVYGVLCVFGLLNCILGYRILRFWMMIFGFIIGAGAGVAVTYMSGVQDKMVIAGAMAGLGIVLAVVSFLIYRAGIFVLGFGIGISLSIYLVHPTSSFSFFLCILIGVGLGVLAMRYAKGVIIIGTSLLGGVLAGFSIAKIAGLAQFPYGVGMTAGIVILGMLIQFAINKDRYDEDDDEEEEEDVPAEEPETTRSERKNRGRSDREYPSDHDQDNRKKISGNREADERDSRNGRRSRKGSDREGRYSDRRERDLAGSRKKARNERSGSDDKKNSRGSSTERRSSSGNGRNRSSGRNYGSDDRRGRSYSQNGSTRGRRNTGTGSSSRYDDPADHGDYEDNDRFDDLENRDTYEDFEKQQQRRRRMDIENMADYDEQEEYGHHRADPDLMNNLDLDDLDEWEDD